MNDAIGGTSSSNENDNRQVLSVGKAPSLCSQCRALNLSAGDFFVPAGERKNTGERQNENLYEPITLDTRPWDSIKNATSCPLCQLLVSAIEMASEEWQAGQAPLHCQISKRLSDYPNNENTRVLEFVAQYKWTASRGSLIPVQSDAYPGAFPGRRIKPGQVDVDQIRRWLQQCETEHRGPCQQPSTGEFDKLKVDILVIDVKARCLRRLGDCCRYFALSYVWGGVNQAEAKLDSLQRLLIPGALNDLGDAVPLTIRDAMEFVEKLGERYLWVDALCIVQDDYTTKQSMIEQMHLIYSQAYATLIAAWGANSDAGLPGVSKSSRKVDQRTASISDDLAFVYPLPFQAIKKAAWATRGWT